MYDSNNNLIASQLSDANGDFNFQGLEPGTYTVSEVLESGWTQTQPVPSYTYTVTVTAGSTDSDLDFGNFQNITISGQAYNDLNGNGKEDPGEPGLQDWTIDLLDSSGNIVATTTTDASGDYSFADLGPGTYTVEEVIPAGWIVTQPASPGTYTVPATSGQDVPGLAFGDYQLVTYSGTVYNDLNGSGTIAPGDPGLAGWTVELLENGNVIATTTSAADGSYSFPDLTYGVYTIEEINTAGWYQTEPAQPFTYMVTATSGASQSGLNFGNFQLVNISGNVYNDLNGNGFPNPGEPGLQGWTVNLLNSAGNTVASVQTDANGNYAFDDVFAGSFTISEVVMSNWVQTQPLYPTTYAVTTQSGKNVASLTFGDFYDPALNPVQVIANGQPGYAETGSWTSSPGGYTGTTRVAKTIRTSGASTASWTFGGLPSGSYEVYVTYAGKNGYSLAAPFSVYDGGTALGTVDINESILVTQSQGGLTQGSYGGVGWLELGTYAISSGTLEVMLSNAANGNYVDANGILIVPDPPAAIHAKTGPSPNVSIGLGVTPTFDAQSTSQTSSKAVTATPTTVAISGVTAPTAVHVIYNQGASASNNTSSASLIDVALSQVGTASNNQGSLQVPDVHGHVAVGNAVTRSTPSYPTRRPRVSVPPRAILEPLRGAVPLVLGPLTRVPGLGPEPVAVEAVTHQMSRGIRRFSTRERWGDSR